MVSWRGGPPGARLPSMHHRRGIRSARSMRPFVHSTIQTTCARTAGHCGARRLSAHLNDVDRTMRSRLRNPRTRRHPLATECADYLAERRRGALERGGVPQRRHRTLVTMRRKSEPSVTLMPQVEMQPARKSWCHLGNSSSWLALGPWTSDGVQPTLQLRRNLFKFTHKPLGKTRFGGRRAQF